MAQSPLVQRRNGLRILVIGGSGSGKSTLARAISDEFAVFHLTLDWMAYEPDEFGQLPSSATLEATARAMARGHSWVVEGAFVGWTRPLAERAHLIIWLDIPLSVALWRIFWRHVKAEIRRDNKFPGWLRLLRFMRTVRWQYRSDSRALDSRITAPISANFESFVAEFSDRSIRRRSMSLAELLEELRRRSIPLPLTGDAETLRSLFP